VTENQLFHHRRSFHFYYHTCRSSTLDADDRVVSKSIILFDHFLFSFLINTRALVINDLIKVMTSANFYIVLSLHRFILLSLWYLSKAHLITNNFQYTVSNALYASDITSINQLMISSSLNISGRTIIGSDINKNSDSVDEAYKKIYH
jgi:hypothetical protein